MRVIQARAVPNKSFDPRNASGDILAAFIFEHSSIGTFKGQPFSHELNKIPYKRVCNISELELMSLITIVNEQVSNKVTMFCLHGGLQ